VDTLLQIGLVNAVLATLLALLAAATACVCRRPAVVHSLWLLVLLKLLTPSLVALPIPWPARAAEKVVESAAEPAAAVDLLPPSLAVPDPSPDETIVPALSLDSQPGDDLGAAPADVGEPTAPEPDFPWQPAVAAVWVTGSLLWWALAVWRLARFQALLRHAQPAPAELQKHVQRLAGSLGLVRCPGVWLVPAPLPPLLWALAGTPRLLLPAELWQQLTDEQCDTLLTHELAHWRRGDHWVRRLELVTLGLYWWHPVAWWARRKLQEAEEQCCDAWVVWALPASGPAYADALLATLTFLSRSAPALPAGASGVGRLHPLKRRLSMIVRGTTPRTLSWPAFLLVLALGSLLPLRPTWAQPAPAAAPADEPKAADQPVLPPATRPVPALPPAAQPAPEKPAELPKYYPSQFEPARREALEKARDEVELAEVQVSLKGAELREAQTHVQQAKRQVERMGRLGKTGALSQAETTKAQDDLELTEVQSEQKTLGVTAPPQSRNRLCSWRL
jgi:bla regulator protein BlaR1